METYVALACNVPFSSEKCAFVRSTRSWHCPQTGLHDSYGIFTNLFWYLVGRGVGGLKNQIFFPKKEITIK